MRSGSYVGTIAAFFIIDTVIIRFLRSDELRFGKDEQFACIFPDLWLRSGWAFCILPKADCQTDCRVRRSAMV